MPPFSNFTTKAKEAVRRAHELAIERGQNHVNPIHLLSALLLQEESTVISMIEKLDIDVMHLTDTLLDSIEAAENAQVLSPSYQIYLTPELAQVLENAAKITAQMNEEFVATEHLFLGVLSTPGLARDILKKFKVTRENMDRVLTEVRESENDEEGTKETKSKFRALTKFTRSLTKLAKENKIDHVIGRDGEI